jgi:hypothetical protein
MRINEIIVEQQLDEGPLGSAVGAVGRGIGKVIGGVAKGVGAIAGIGAGAKKAFQKGKQASTDVIGGTGQGADAPVQKAAPAATAAAPAAAPAGGGASAAQPAASGAAQGGAPAAAPAQPAAQPAAQGGAPAAQPAAKPAAGSSDVDAVIQQVDQLQPPEKKEVLAALQKPAAPAKEEPAAQPAANAAAQPAAQSGAEQQPDDGLTQGQRDQQQAVQQMKTTADANAAASGQRNEVEAAGKAAAAKPGFQRTAADKLAIKQAQDMGVKVEDIEDDLTMIREYVEEYILFKPQITRTLVKESRRPKQKFSIYKS